MPLTLLRNVKSFRGSRILYLAFKYKGVRAFLEVGQQPSWDFKEEEQMHREPERLK